MADPLGLVIVGSPALIEMRRVAARLGMSEGSSSIAEQILPKFFGMQIS